MDPMANGTIEEMFDSDVDSGCENCQVRTFVKTFADRDIVPYTLGTLIQRQNPLRRTGPHRLPIHPFLTPSLLSSPSSLLSQPPARRNPHNPSLRPVPTQTLSLLPPLPTLHLHSHTSPPCADRGGVRDGRGVGLRGKGGCSSIPALSAEGFPVISPLYSITAWVYR